MGRKQPLGIKSGPQRVYEFLLDKPPGYRIAWHTHEHHIPLTTGTLSSALSGLERKGAIRAVERLTRIVLPNAPRRVHATVFEWLGPIDDIRFSAGHRPDALRKVPRGVRGGEERRELPVKPQGPRHLRDLVGRPSYVEGPDSAPQPSGGMGTFWDKPGHAIIDDPHAPAAVVVSRLAPEDLLPTQPTLSDQLLLLAVRIDRARRAGTPSAVFNRDTSLRDVALPKRAELVDKLLELAQLAEELEHRCSGK